MKKFDLWKLSLLNVFSAPVRSMLTVLGFAIGVAAILAVLTLGEAGRIQVQSEMQRLGIDKIWITSTGDKPLQHGAAAWLSELTGAEADEFSYLPVQVMTEKGNTASIRALGCEQQYLQNIQVVKGRIPWYTEWYADAQCVLMGEKLAEKLKVQVGEWIHLSNQTCYVCGIIGPGEGVSSIALDETVILPLEALCRMTNGVVHEIQFTAPEMMPLQTAQKLVRNNMTQAGYEVNVATMEIQMEAASSVIYTFVNVLKWVALICILVGGIGVMNILLVSIRERKREIGVMKSLGTTPIQICVLFLLEAMIYAVIGGVLGILLGMGLIDAAGASIELTAQANLRDCVSVLCAALGIGMLFGVLPAFRASILTCVDALRQE